MARGFRNLAPTELTLPPEGIALLGANAQGKTNLLEAVYYPVLFRSFRGATDSAVAGFHGPGFRVESNVTRNGKAGTIAAEFRLAPKRKRIEIDGAGRRYLDRLLCLADRKYLTALTRYRSVLSQRNAALRHDRRDVVRAFDEALARAGAEIVSSRVRWADTATGMFAEEFAALGEKETVGLRYGRCLARCHRGGVAHGFQAGDYHRRASPRRSHSRDRRAGAQGVRLDRPAAECGDRAQAPRARHPVRGLWYRASARAG